MKNINIRFLFNLFGGGFCMLIGWFVAFAALAPEKDLSFGITAAILALPAAACFSLSSCIGDEQDESKCSTC